MDNTNNKPIRVLFVCVKKGIRASLAKAIIEQKSHGLVKATCSGFEKGGTPQFIIEDVSKLVSPPFELEAKTIFEYRIENEPFDVVITLCDEIGSEDCTIFRHVVKNTYPDVQTHFIWSIPNFSLAMAISGSERTQCIAEIVKKIENKVDQFLQEWLEQKDKEKEHAN